MKDDDILTEQEAEAMLVRLSQFYDAPVLPLPRFCAAMRTWFRAVQARGEAPYAKMLDEINIDISKSNLLDRLLYAGEELRTRECPVHQGRWNGQAMLLGCDHDCDGTGWLREESGSLPTTRTASEVESSRRCWLCKKEGATVRTKPEPPDYQEWWLHPACYSELQTILY